MNKETYTTSPHNAVLGNLELITPGFKKKGVGPMSHKDKINTIRFFWSKKHLLFLNINYCIIY